MPFDSMDLIISLCLLLGAVLYTSVGHAGASVYIAIMSLFGLASPVIKPTALVLNVFISSFTSWRVYFIMPETYSLSTLPVPNNPKVVIRELPNKKVAAHQFSGLVTENKMQEKVALLSDWLNKKSLKSISNPELARYNPPWTLPFLRRNEIMIEID